MMGNEACNKHINKPNNNPPLNNNRALSIMLHSEFTLSLLALNSKRDKAHSFLMIEWSSSVLLCLLVPDPLLTAHGMIEMVHSCQLTLPSNVPNVTLIPAYAGTCMNYYMTHMFHVQVRLGSITSTLYWYRGLIKQTLIYEFLGLKLDQRYLLWSATDDIRSTHLLFSLKMKACRQTG